MPCTPIIKSSRVIPWICYTVRLTGGEPSIERGIELTNVKGENMVLIDSGKHPSRVYVNNAESNGISLAPPISDGRVTNAFPKMFERNGVKKCVLTVPYEFDPKRSALVRIKIFSGTKGECDLNDVTPFASGQVILCELFRSSLDSLVQISDGQSIEFSQTIQGSMRSFFVVNLHGQVSIKNLEEMTKSFGNTDDELINHLPDDPASNETVIDSKCSGGTSL